MTLRISDLKNFIEAAMCSTMTEAARKLEITQPALSESIKRLEEDLGSILFYRARSGITLTSTGKSVLEKANKSVSALAEVLAHKNDSISFKGRRVTIGCHPTIASYFLPKALNILGTRSTDYRIDLKHDLSRNIQSEIQKGMIDIGIVVNPIPSPDLVIRHLAFDNVCVWSAQKKSTNTEKLICNMTLIQTQSILRKWKNRPTEIVDTDNLELITRLTEHQIGYGIIPERAVNLLGAKLAKHTELPQYKDTISIVHRPEFGKISFEKELISAFKAAIQ